MAMFRGFLEGAFAGYGGLKVFELSQVAAPDLPIGGQLTMGAAAGVMLLWILNRLNGVLDKLLDASVSAKLTADKQVAALDSISQKLSIMDSERASALTAADDERRKKMDELIGRMSDNHQEKAL